MYVSILGEHNYIIITVHIEGVGWGCPYNTVTCLQLFISEKKTYL